MKKKQFLECGKIHNTHGIRGALKVEPYCDSAKVFASLPVVYLRDGENFIPLKVEQVSGNGTTLLVRLKGIGDPESAEKFKGQLLYADRADIPLQPGAYFLADLPGLPVLDAETGRSYGEISEVRNIGGRDYLAVATEKGERLVPMLPVFLERVDTESGVYVRPIPGLLEDE